MEGLRPGGMTLVPDSLIPEIFCSGAITAGGLGDFDPIALKKARTGKHASVSVFMNERWEGLAGSCSPKDFETMMQLTSLIITDIRRDTAAYLAYKDNLRQGLLNQDMDPYTELNDSINSILYLNHPYRQRLTTDMLEKVDYNRILKQFRDCYGNAEGFTFVFVGNTGEEAVKPLIVSYLGSLPARPWNRKTENPGISTRNGIYSRSFIRKQETAKSTNILTYQGLCPFTLRNNVLMEMACQLLNITLMQQVREEKSGTYHIQAGGNIMQYPEAKAFMQIHFETSPEKRDTLMQAVRNEVRRMAEEGPTEEDLDKIKEYMLKSRTDALKENGSWLSWITGYLQAGLDTLHGFEDTVRQITPQNIATFLQDMLKQDNRIEITMTSPEKE